MDTLRFLVFLDCTLGSFFFFSSRRRHTRCALVTGVQTCALPICARRRTRLRRRAALEPRRGRTRAWPSLACGAGARSQRRDRRRSEEHTPALPSLMRISYADFCLKKKNQHRLKHARHKPTEADDNHSVRTVQDKQGRDSTTTIIIEH